MKGIITLKFIKIAGNDESIYDGNKAVKDSASKVVRKYSDGIKRYLKRHSIDAEVVFTIEDGK